MRGTLALLALFAGLAYGQQSTPAAPLQNIWKQQKSGTEVQLRGISAVSDKVAWASGAKGTVLRTIDGGETWQNITGDGKSGFPAGEGVGRIGLAVYPKNPQVVFAVVDNNFRKPDTARRSADTAYERPQTGSPTVRHAR